MSQPPRQQSPERNLHKAHARRKRQGDSHTGCQEYIHATMATQGCQSLTQCAAGAPQHKRIMWHQQHTV